MNSYKKNVIEKTIQLLKYIEKINLVMFPIGNAAASVINGG